MTYPKTLLLTRASEQSDAFARVLETRMPGRFEVVIAPLITIEPRADALDLTGVQAVIFTSANGVAQFAARSRNRNLPALCVGPLTADAARAEGFVAHSADGDVAALARLAVQMHQPEGGSMLHIRGEHAAGDLIGALSEAGIPARAAEIYAQTLCPIPPDALARLVSGDVDIVAHFSPRTARHFVQQCDAANISLAYVQMVSISAAADNALGDLATGQRWVAERPNRDSMMSIFSRI